MAECELKPTAALIGQLNVFVKFVERLENGNGSDGEFTLVTVKV